MAEDDPGDVADIIAVIGDPSATFWLKNALSTALDRDPFDAERDALVLAALLTKRLDALVARHFTRSQT